MLRWQLFIPHRHPVTFLITAFIYYSMISCSSYWTTTNCYFNLREHSANRKDLKALTLVGPPRNNPEPDYLALLHLDNRLFIFHSIPIVNTRWTFIPQKASKKLGSNILALGAHQFMQKTLLGPLVCSRTNRWGETIKWARLLKKSTKQ